MRELAAFYCPKCGYYAYYQTSRHPQCPRCNSKDTMNMVRMHYKEFMNMSCQERPIGTLLHNWKKQSGHFYTTGKA